ncbi:MAG: hypothetical protein ACOX60_06335 [Massiliimalia sp.]|jgi:hypothetical protein
MTDWEELLAQETGLPAAVTAWTDPPQLPYYVITEYRQTDGADRENNWVVRQMTLELYSDIRSPVWEEQTEKLLDQMGIHYEKQQEWIAEEQFFMTSYEFEQIEK